MKKVLLLEVTDRLQNHNNYERLSAYKLPSHDLYRYDIIMATMETGRRFVFKNIFTGGVGYIDNIDITFEF